ncbi:hypothetical protein PCURB6_28710 [Paenibacillus curdlanolyticus]|nr:hypothetical protein [Paenibacillus curdlanolyticus]GFN32611.1 hypothetical protein PCURB6_28710 [Paenibacillus curdlanolyticus]
MTLEKNISPILNRLRSGMEGDEFVVYTNVPETVVDGRVQLSEIPDRVQKVQVIDLEANTHYYETQNEYPSELQYVVDYNTGIIKYNSAAEGKVLSHSFYGRGIILTPVDRIYTKHENGQVIETLGDIIQAGQDVFDNIDTLNTLYDEVTKVKDSYKYDIEDYSALKHYKVNNQVTYNGKTYICIQDTVGHSPVDENYWRIFASGSDSIIRSKMWTTVANQTDFDISDVGRYAMGTRKLEVMVGGSRQFNGVHFDEISSTLFRFKSPLPAGLIVFAQWFDGDIGTAAGHNAQHKKGGGDELNVNDLAGADEYVKKASPVLNGTVSVDGSILGFNTKTTAGDEVVIDIISSPVGNGSATSLSTKFKRNANVEGWESTDVILQRSTDNTNQQSIVLEGAGGIQLNASGGNTGNRKIRVNAPIVLPYGGSLQAKDISGVDHNYLNHYNGNTVQLGSEAFPNIVDKDANSLVRALSGGFKVQSGSVNGGGRIFFS